MPSAWVKHVQSVYQKGKGKGLTYSAAMQKAKVSWAKKKKGAAAKGAAAAKGKAAGLMDVNVGKTGGRGGHICGQLTLGLPHLAVGCRGVVRVLPIQMVACRRACNGVVNSQKESLVFETRKAAGNGRATSHDGELIQHLWGFHRA